jgi:hypothetical protein
MLAEAEITAYAKKMARVLAGAEEFPDRWVRLRKRWAARPWEEQPSGAKLRRAYEEATGTVVDFD